MQFISKVTVKYFRSLHIVEVKKCTSINIFSGRNDAGKSNVIKALNLFFNGQADWGSNYSFYENFSKKRLEEVRKDSVKGKQFISIKVEFNRPTNYKGSLPERFSIERKWHRDSKTYEQTDNLSTFDKNGQLPSTLTTAQRSLAKFLNKLHFEYVPAIRDRDYVSELLSRLQRSLLDVSINQNDALMKTANTLALHIESQIGDLKGDFEEATNIETSIKPPSSISSLFQSFLVSTKTNDGSVPLRFRGDGLQSRYIASVLHYISMNSSDFYIWGYEEPEIALEYSHVSKMAADFSDKYSNNAQIFISTHSPAFIALKGDDISCYRVSQNNSATIVANVAIDSDLKGKEKLKEELGVIEIQKEVHEYYSSELNKLKFLAERIRQLESEVDEFKRPLVVTEGKTDCLILAEAIKKVSDSELNVCIRACDNAGDAGGNGGAGPLGKLIESIHPEDNRLVIAVFDNDDEGQKEYHKLSKNFKPVSWDLNIKKHTNGFAWAMLLPEPDFREGFVEAKNLCIEYLFTDEVLEKEFSNGRTLELKEPSGSLVIGGQKLNDIPKEFLTILEEKAKLYRKVGSGKDSFSREVVPHLDKTQFEGFSKVFDMIGKIISSNED